MAGNAFAAARFDDVVLDPSGEVRPALLEAALKALRAHPEARRDRLAVVDFALPSTAKRFFVIDLSTGAVAAYLTAHGKGSDPTHSGYATAFSDSGGSNQSSLGTYRTGARYFGQHGLSLRLIGLDASNRGAEERAIVLHGAPYMDAPFRQMHGRPGRSFGCFVVETHLIEEVVTDLEGGVLIYAGI
jgi:hypothetical protein